ncbi:hypothetical protein J437_LFUL018846 [Ladona fulva]|uniref:Mutator-like transposase domain-containing protein n=1 Tax=Ladona fulva TaxID=123851 RepID=A0A8K0KTL6_LADFU|nr:hypothetical protein J437_LFUL018846 [Ladona fulva]
MKDLICNKERLAENSGKSHQTSTVDASSGFAVSSTDDRNPMLGYVECSVDENFAPNKQVEDLIVETDCRRLEDDVELISGRFIVDGQHLVRALRAHDFHRFDCQKSNNGYMKLVSSSSKSLVWSMTFKCPYCHQLEIVTSEPMPVLPKNCTRNTSTVELTLAEQAVWGFTSIGSGQRNMEEVWKDVLLNSMEQAGIEEKKLAIERGDVTTNGTPFITVIADGGWSHRSHGHRYTANSGVACIIGQKTKKLLHIEV